MSKTSSFLAGCMTTAERLFRRLKAYRRIFSRFEKLDVMFTALMSFALVADALRLC